MFSEFSHLSPCWALSVFLPSVFSSYCPLFHLRPAHGIPRQGKTSLSKSKCCCQCLRWATARTLSAPFFSTLRLHQCCFIGRSFTSLMSWPHLDVIWNFRVIHFAENVVCTFCCSWCCCLLIAPGGKVRRFKTLLQPFSYPVHPIYRSML